MSGLPEENKVPVLPNPKPRRTRTNRKLLTLLFLFFVTILAVLFFRSSLSRISEIKIEGNELLSSEEIGQAAAVQKGDHFFAARSESVRERVAALRMVQSVEVSKHFPGQINIVVHEYPRVAFQFGADGVKQAVLADGSTVPVVKEDLPVDKPILTGWTENDPNRIALCKALAAIPAGYLSDISEIRPDPSEAYKDKIKMYTRTRFEVVTTVGYLPNKIMNLSAYITSMQGSEVNSGVLVLLETDDHLPLDTSATGNKGKAGTASTKKPDPTPKPDGSVKPTSTPQKDTTRKSDTGGKEGKKDTPGTSKGSPAPN
ncbi:FtsQ-type POTRA domain-containing protein [Paenibacillus chitinolyticus]|uniref:cell division protein FtsQ/DivIB n=1 Tax=Paenibacillus chitinolyticus TaxID=79263 RepID=UPI002DBD249B|nr:FtsQ-type POTRA domain-containing protein [Paenibacillus chitinolyticus]MEC0246632.1 FtsQ-type POTRA domain-containing protein [Paenibacillus chitinolyticus]